MEPRPLAERVSAVSALAEPLRRTLFQLVARSATPVSRDEAAATLGLARSTAAFHLDRLVDEGLLAVEFRRLTGRTGPGAGRPSKLYARASDGVEVMVPERRYDLAAQLLVTAVEQSTRTGDPVHEVLRSVVAGAGRELGSASGSPEAVLEEQGFEPRADGDAVELANCPFDRLARDHTETVCGLNLDLVGGILDGASDRARVAVLDPAPGRCCVRVVPRPPAPTV